MKQNNGPLLIFLLVVFVGVISLPAIINQGPFVPAVAEVSVLIVEESADRPRLPAGQLTVLNSTEMRDWCKSHCDKDEGGHPEFRVLDKDDDVSHLPQKWRDRFEESKKLPTPNIAVSTGKSGAEGDLPLTLEETMRVLKKYGGE